MPFGLLGNYDFRAFPVDTERDVRNWKGEKGVVSVQVLP